MTVSAQVAQRCEMLPLDKSYGLQGGHARSDELVAGPLRPPCLPSRSMAATGRYGRPWCTSGAGEGVGYADPVPHGCAWCPRKPSERDVLHINIIAYTDLTLPSMRCNSCTMRFHANHSTLWVNECASLC